MVPVTQQAHEIIRRVVRTGESVIDATAGNGHDTLFLAQCVGPRGSVYAFDIQDAAINATRQRIQAAGVENVCLIQDSHEHMRQRIPEASVGHIAAVMFNLGYLPGGDQSIVTCCNGTRRAIASAQMLLRTGGVLSVVAYPGHAEGAVEAAWIANWIESLDGAQFEIAYRSDRWDDRSPRLSVIRRKDGIDDEPTRLPAVS